MKICIKKQKIKFKYACVISLIIGALIFFILYGPHIINPLYTDWIKLGTLDFKQDYYGWLFFSRDNWSFPFGMFDSLSYPNKISIIYTDSIPLFALFFKFFLKIFNYNAEFQYFGLWGLACFMFQSMFGMIIARRIIKSNIVCVFAGILFCLSFPFLCNMFNHTALTSHWLILFSTAVFVWNKILIKKKFWIQCVIFSIIGFFCAGIHIYLILMCGVFLFGYSLFYFLNSYKKDKNPLKTILNSLLLLFVYIVTCLIVIYAIGGFSSNIEYQSYWFYSFFRADALIFFESKGLSNFNTIRTISENSQAGGYCGLGVLFLFIVSVFFNKKIQNINLKVIIYFLILTFIFIYIASMFPVFKLNNKLIFEIDLSGFIPIKKIAGIFRANGRFIIVDVYLLLIFSLIFISKLKTKTVLFLVLFAIFLQSFDLSKFYINKLSYFRNLQTFSPKICLPVEFDLRNKIIIVDKNFFIGRRRIIDMYLADYAYKNNLKLTYYYFAREIKNRNYYFEYKIKNPQKFDIFALSPSFIKSKEFMQYNLRCSKLIKQNSSYFCQI